MTRSISAIRSTTRPPQTHNRLAPGHRLTTLPIICYLTLSRSTRPRFAQRRLFHGTLSQFYLPLRTTSTKWERVSILSLKASHRGNPTCSRTERNSFTKLATPAYETSASAWAGSWRCRIFIYTPVPRSDIVQLRGSDKDKEVSHSLTRIYVFKNITHVSGCVYYVPDGTIGISTWAAFTDPNDADDPLHCSMLVFSSRFSPSSFTFDSCVQLVFSVKNVTRSPNIWVLYACYRNENVLRSFVKVVS